MAIGPGRLRHLAFPDGKAERLRVEPDPLPRSPFQLDKERIVRSRAFRRLKHKTQVFFQPRNDLFRTRLTHTIESAQVARTIAQCLGLNADLAEAVALAHDLGHAPFGHEGERALTRSIEKHAPGNDFTFDHSEHSVKLVTMVEKYKDAKGVPHRGLNLTKQVVDGIVNRKESGPQQATTQEALVAGLADDITYVNHDFEDLMDAGAFPRLVSATRVFETKLKELGHSHEGRIQQFTLDIVNASTDAVRLSPEKRDLLNAIKRAFEDEVLSDPSIKNKERGAAHVIEALFDYFTDSSNHPEWERLNKQGLLRGSYEGVRDGTVMVVVEYIARMTDTFALDLYRRLISPEITEYYF